MARLEPMDASKVEVVPPWEREECHYMEVPAVLKHQYNLRVQPRTVYRWINTGLPQTKPPEERSYLKAVRRAGKLFVRMADLKAFINAI